MNSMHWKDMPDVLVFGVSCLASPAGPEQAPAPGDEDATSHLERPGRHEKGACSRDEAGEGA